MMPTALCVVGIVIAATSGIRAEDEIGVKRHGNGVICHSLEIEPCYDRAKSLPPAKEREPEGTL